MKGVCFYVFWRPERELGPVQQGDKVGSRPRSSCLPVNHSQFVLSNSAKSIMTMMEVIMTMIQWRERPAPNPKAHLFDMETLF